MGEEVPYDKFPGTGAIDMEDYFKPVRLSPRAINEASKIVPIEGWITQGLHAWLQIRANHVFGKLSADLTEGRLGVMRYFFEYDKDGPVLKSVSI